MKPLPLITQLLANAVTVAYARREATPLTYTLAGISLALTGVFIWQEVSTR